jgi:hypothetical protein
MANHSDTPGMAPVPPGTPTANPHGRSFIGGKSKEFQAARRTPTGAKMAAPPDTEEPQKPAEEEAPEETGIPCSSCGADVQEDHLFCSMCGLEQGRKDVIKALGVELTEEDLSEYIFKGYLVKDIPLVHGKMGTFKTLLPIEANACEDAITDRFKDKDATNTQWTNVYAQMYLSYGWIKFDGNSLGETPEKRSEFIDKSIGVHLLDIASKKWSLFNRAIAALLEDPDALKN